MKWNEPIYLGSSLREDPGKARRLKWRIRHHGGTLNAYLVTLASNPQNLMDLVPAKEILQKGYPRRNLTVIGLAADYYEALELVRSMIEEVYQARHDTNLRAYLLDRKEKQP